MSNIDKYTNFIAEQVRRGDTVGLRTGIVNEAATSIVNQRKGSKTSSGVSYDDIKQVKKHFQDHGFYTQSGAKTKEGTHRISFIHLKSLMAPGAQRNKLHAQNTKNFEKAVKSSPIPIHRHETVDTKFGDGPLAGTPSVADPHRVHLKA